MEYSCRYAETHPTGESCRHLLSEAHLILRASLVQPLPPARGDPGELPQAPTDGEQPQRQMGGPTDACTDSEAERQVMEAAFRENCAQLGDCFSRYSETNKQPHCQKHTELRYILVSFHSKQT